MTTYYVHVMAMAPSHRLSPDDLNVVGVHPIDIRHDTPMFQKYDDILANFKRKVPITCPDDFHCVVREAQYKKSSRVLDPPELLEQAARRMESWELLYSERDSNGLTEWLEESKDAFLFSCLDEDVYKRALQFHMARLLEKAPMVLLLSALVALIQEGSVSQELKTLVTKLRPNLIHDFFSTEASASKHLVSLYPEFPKYLDGFLAMAIDSKTQAPLTSVIQSYLSQDEFPLVWSVLSQQYPDDAKQAGNIIPLLLDLFPNLNSDSYFYDSDVLLELTQAYQLYSQNMAGTLLNNEISFTDVS